MKLVCEDCSSGVSGIGENVCQGVEGEYVGKGIQPGKGVQPVVGEGITGEAVVGDGVRASTQVPFSISQRHGCSMHCFIDVALSQTNFVGRKDGEVDGIVVSVGF